MGLYPRYDLTENPRLAGWEANCRAALPDMLAALDRTDLIAVTDLARLLVVVSREAGLLRGSRGRGAGEQGGRGAEVRGNRGDDFSPIFPSSNLPLFPSAFCERPTGVL